MAVVQAILNILSGAASPIGPATILGVIARALAQVFFARTISAVAILEAIFCRLAPRRVAGSIELAGTIRGAVKASLPLVVIAEGVSAMAILEAIAGIFPSRRIADSIQVAGTVRRTGVVAFKKRIALAVAATAVLGTVGVILSRIANPIGGTAISGTASVVFPKKILTNGVSAMTVHDAVGSGLAGVAIIIAADGAIGRRAID